MAYRWDDLQADRLEVEWGEDLRGTRRARTLRRAAEGCGGGWTAALVAVLTLAAVGMASTVGLALVRSPAPRRDENPSNAVDAGRLPVVEASTHSPTYEPSAKPTGRPSPPPTFSPTTARPTDLPTATESRSPSLMGSALPSISSSQRPSVASSASPSAVPKAPPAPEPTPKPTPKPKPTPCIDQPGFYHNHAGDKVSCDWFATVGTHNFQRNCARTDAGRACLFACRDYVDCVRATPRPSRRPSPPPTSAPPTPAPTPEPPRIVTIGAAGDASVKEAVPDANFGRASWLKVDPKPRPLPQDPPGGSGGAFHAMLRFDLSKHEATRPVATATLRLRAANGCSSGGYLQRTHSPHWDEDAVTWATAPEGDGTEVGRLGTITAGFWYSVDVTSALLPGHKALSLRLYPAGSDACLFASKDHADGDGPELHIVYGNA